MTEQRKITDPDGPIHPFDAATSVRMREDGAFVGQAGGNYWAFVGPFGGATAASMLRAILQHAERRGEPLAMTVNFAAPLEAADYCIDVRCTRRNRSTQHWNAEIRQGDDPQPKASATAVLGERRVTLSHQSAVPPTPRPREELPVFDPSGTPPWVSRYRFHFDAGAPILSASALADPQSAFSQLWMADAPERPLDVLSLTAIADAFFGRIFHVLGTIVPFGTVSMTTYFHAAAEELAAVGPWVIGRVDARRFHRSFNDQTGELWSPDGRLLATTHQLAFFKA
jgi:acyl-CoA thioesterase